MSARKKKSPKAVIHLTQRSISDLREIERYSIGQWGQKVADKYLSDISLALDQISQDPSILSLQPSIAPGLFFYRVKKHFLVCDYHLNTVLVLTVIHATMDLPARLLELEPGLASEALYLQAKNRKKL